MGCGASTGNKYKSEGEAADKTLEEAKRKLLLAQLQKLPASQQSIIREALALLEDAGVREVEDVSALRRALKSSSENGVDVAEVTLLEQMQHSNETLRAELRDSKVKLLEVARKPSTRSDVLKGADRADDIGSPCGSPKEGSSEEPPVEPPPSKCCMPFNNSRQSKSSRTYKDVVHELEQHGHLVSSFEDLSTKIKKSISGRIEMLSKIADDLIESPWRHDEVYHHLGYEELQKTAVRVKSTYDGLMQYVAEQVNGRFIAVPVKGERGLVKCQTRYGGDASQVSDMVRGTIEIPMGPDALKHMYRVADMLANMEVLRAAGCYTSFFDDRWQSPKGEYRDLLFLLKISGFVCELQVNVRDFIEIKESPEGHGYYEVVRMHNDDLLFATMNDNNFGVTEAISHKADPNIARDMYGLGPLHYAAQSGNPIIVRALLDAKANVLAVDNLGRMPIHRALFQKHMQVAECLMDMMEVIKEPSFGAKTALSSWALAELMDGMLANHMLEEQSDFVLRLAKWAAPIFASNATSGGNAPVSMWHAWAARGRIIATRLALNNKLLQDVLGPCTVRSSVDGRTPLDHAVAADMEDLALLLSNQGCNLGHDAFVEDSPSWTSKICSSVVDGSKSDDESVKSLLTNATCGLLLPKASCCGTSLGEREASLRRAAQSGDLLTIRACLAGGANPNSSLPAEKGRTALLWAAYMGHHDACILLLALQSDPKAQDAEGRSAMVLANKTGNFGVARALAQSNPAVFTLKKEDLHVDGDWVAACDWGSGELEEVPVRIDGEGGFYGDGYAHVLKDVIVHADQDPVVVTFRWVNRGYNCGGPGKWILSADGSTLEGTYKNDTRSDGPWQWTCVRSDKNKLENLRNLKRGNTARTLTEDEEVGVTIEIKRDDGNSKWWEPYGEEVSRNIAKAMARGHTRIRQVFETSRGQEEYIIDFETMLQTNMNTGLQRTIRTVKLPGDVKMGA